MAITDTKKNPTRNDPIIPPKSQEVNAEAQPLYSKNTQPILASFIF
jgi:hypothetical protein